MKKEILTREKIIHDLNYIYSTKNIIIFALNNQYTHYEL